MEMHQMKDEIAVRSDRSAGHYANAKTYQEHELEECITEID